MKNMHKKSKLYEDDDEYLDTKTEKNERRKHRNWKRAWMEHAHEAEEHDEFFR